MASNNFDRLSEMVRQGYRLELFRDHRRCTAILTIRSWPFNKRVRIVLDPQEFEAAKALIVGGAIKTRVRG